ncbi:MAG: hypothetical protein QOF32_742, partial [Gammaproteobacteria bacterium]|nr:hypothetical protein [Gammaproteobacteria bacterium]
SPALPPLNIHPHGHKRGAHVESAGDSGSDTAAQVPAGAAQNLFGNLLQSLEQVIGVQPATGTAATPTPAAATSASAGAAPTPGAAAATAATASADTPTAQSANALLQNYLNNVSQTLQANGTLTQKLAGSNVSVNA